VCKDTIVTISARTLWSLVKGHLNRHLWNFSLNTLKTYCVPGRQRLIHPPQLLLGEGWQEQWMITGRGHSIGDRGHETLCAQLCCFAPCHLSVDKGSSGQDREIVWENFKHLKFSLAI
jgi:hypothetical protein